MNRRYELDMAKGKFPIADPGLEFWNEILKAQFEDYIFHEIKKSLKSRILISNPSIQEETESNIRRIEPIVFKEKHYFLETQFNVYEIPRYIVYDYNYKPLKEAHNINEILKFLK